MPQIPKIQPIVYRPREQDIRLKVDELITRVNLLLDDYNYKDANEI